MKRFLMKELIEWKNKEDRKPLIIMGARQVGKTWLMKEFGRTQFEKMAYISFYNNKKMSDIFESDFDKTKIMLNFSIETGVNITPENTLIILDEIQNAPKVIEALKYFSEEASEYYIVCAGSLLGVALHNGVSYPVGKVDLLDLHPLNFREFLLAVGEEALEKALELKDYDIIDVFSDKYIFWLKNYYYIGGMPEVVNRFSLNKDYKEVRSIQKSIIRQYRGDFGKHVKDRELPRINMVWESIPMQLAKENKKFFFGQIKKGARSSEFETAIQWLTDCGLVYKVNKVNEPKIPLSFYKDFSSYKLFLIDIGILCAMTDLDEKTIISGNEIFVEFKGALTEQYVLQQLVSDNKYVPYYFGTEKSNFEQDFMVQKDGNIVPIEVKAECNVHSRSLRVFCDKYPIKKAVRFSMQKHIDQGWMENIPLYAVCNL